MSYRIHIEQPDRHYVRLLRLAGVYVRVIALRYPPGENPILIRRFVLPDGSMYESVVCTSQNHDTGGENVWQEAWRVTPEKLP